MGDPIRHINRGKPPRDKSIRLGIEWGNGVTSKHSFTANQLRWSLTGDAFDVGRFWKVGDGM